MVTHPKIDAPPSSRAAAMDQIDAWLESPALVLLGGSGSHWSTLRALVNAGRVAGPRVHDARTAALRVQHAVGELRTSDRDFNRCAQLKTRNPLVG